MHKDAQVAVVGLGAFGSAAAWRLAARGLSVFGLERYSVPHSLGSSHGGTRLFRSISQNHADLHPLAMLSRDLWLELGELRGEDLYEQTGGLVVGPSGGQLISDTERVLNRHAINAERLTAGGVRAEFPEFETVDEGDVGYFDPKAGILRAERCVSQLCAAAEQAGAELHTDVEVLGHAVGGGGVVLETSQGEVRADKVVFATGVWTAQLFPRLNLTPVRIPQCWFRYAAPTGGAPGMDRMPPFQRELGTRGSVWGHGAAVTDGLAKIGTHGNPRLDRRVDPDRIDREVQDHDLAFVSDLVAVAFPALDPRPAYADICLLTETLDAQFVVGEVQERVLVASGGSGQGFKHATGVGEVVADLCAGAPSRVETAFISPRRLLG